MLGLALGACGDGRESVSTFGRITFTNPLKIPPLAESTVQNSVRTFRIAAGVGETYFVSGKSTSTWGYNGSYLGPTLRAARGETVQVIVTNNLTEVTSVHWHGMHLPAVMDGGPHQPIGPGSEWAPTWTIDQRAATLWYHPHPHGKTEAHMFRGLSGLFIVDDDDESALDLPRAYGIDDIPIILQDRTFDDEGEFDGSFRATSGRIGESILINGTVAPFFESGNRRLRLRVLNASTARFYNIGFAADRQFQLIATDGGLLPIPVNLDRVLISPGERVEILLSLEPDERFQLRSFLHDLGMSEDREDAAGANDELDLLEIRAAATLVGDVDSPEDLVSTEQLVPVDSTQTREIKLGNNRINGDQMDLKRIDQIVGADTLELWSVTNDHGQIHNFHVHDVQFQVLKYEGGPSPSHLQGWKDTIHLRPEKTAELAIPFGGYVDPLRPYMYHCHLIWHEDQGMMGQFTVVSPEEVDSAPSEIDDSHMEH